MSKKDYYEILGITKSATEDEIKQAFRRLASKFHPDKIIDEAEKKVAEEKFKEIKEAYDTLGNPTKRAQYNLKDSGFSFDHAFNRNTGSDYFNNSQTHHNFDEILRTFRSTNFDNLYSKGQQNIHVITISLPEAYTGKSLRIDSFTTLNIPKGMRSGTKFYINGKIYRADIQQHYKFKRSNDDLLFDLEITAIEAMLGVEVSLEHLDNNVLQFTVPAGIQQGQVVKLSNKGMKNPETDRIGDMLIRITISIPKTLTDDEKTLLKTIAHRVTINI